MIIKKYYDKYGRLRLLNSTKTLTSEIIRFKILKNGKEFPCCDWKGICKNKAYAEVYPMAIKGKRRKGWSYLCRKHYFQEEKRYKWKLPACLSVEW